MSSSGSGFPGLPRRVQEEIERPSTGGKKKGKGVALFKIGL